jgi:hypothetical protein
VCHVIPCRLRADKLYYTHGENVFVNRRKQFIYISVI